MMRAPLAALLLSCGPPPEAEVGRESATVVGWCRGHGVRKLGDGSTRIACAVSLEGVSSGRIYNHAVGVADVADCPFRCGRLAEVSYLGQRVIGVAWVGP